jgi:hypothetical protein
MRLIRKFKVGLCAAGLAGVASAAMLVITPSVASANGTITCSVSYGSTTGVSCTGLPLP